MDLTELKNQNSKRHPWELARLEALRIITRQLQSFKGNLTVLDVGCGDGYISRELFKISGVENIICLDIHLSEKQIQEFSRQGKKIVYINKYSEIDGQLFDLILLLDILEHVEDDKTFLSDIVQEHLNVNGYILITVPAFQLLYSAHDRYLKHCRRYNIKDIIYIVHSAGLEDLSSGYLFCTLLFLRFMSLLCQRLSSNMIIVNSGVGDWRRGELITKFIEFVLSADNKFCLFMNKLDLKIPGLTCWVLCKKQQ
jgi:SAM-dependent methyltransferase